MPQFDTFSFFSQFFWVFLAFCYLYLILSFYLLPAFAAVLKIRSRKLALTNSTTNTNIVLSDNSSITSTALFDSLTFKLNGINFYRSNLIDNLNISFLLSVLKNETFFSFNSLVLNQFKIVTFFA